MKSYYFFPFLSVYLLTSFAFLETRTDFLSSFHIFKEEVIEDDTIKLVFGGDVMLSRTVNAKMQKYDNYVWPFEEIASIFSDADLSFINLESPFYHTHNYHVPTGSFVFYANPYAINGLTHSGIDVVSLANNHFGNKGNQGMLDTFSLLEKNQINYIGAGRNEEDAHTPKIFEVKDVKIGFLGYAYPETLYVASDKRSGIANMNIDKAIEDVKNLKKQVDFVIVSMHAGQEYTHNANWQQKEFSHALIDSGADLIIGHHPHVIQEMEVYNGKYIFYSLGNLVFDQMWSEKTRQGLIIEVSIKDKKVYDIKYIPVEIEDFGKPYPVYDEEKKQKIISYLQFSSNTLTSD